jgi:hypothetical protein
MFLLIDHSSLSLEAPLLKDHAAPRAQFSRLESRGRLSRPGAQVRVLRGQR